MSSKKYITPLSLKRKAVEFRKPVFKNIKEELSQFFESQHLSIQMNNLLMGGVDSCVYDAVFENESVIVKHTDDRSYSLYAPPFTPIDFYVPRENHNLDTKILSRLSNSEIKVPRVIKTFPKITTTIMSDLRTEGYELHLFTTLNKELNINNAQNIGYLLKLLHRTFEKWNLLRTYKSPEGQIFERGLELRLFYPNDQRVYLELEKQFLSNSNQLIWPDSHPKNMFIDQQGNAAFIDFGGCIYGDIKFVLPNFLGQVLVYYLTGYIEKELITRYFDEVIKGYGGVEDNDEEIFCKYLAMEILHRSSGKWLAGIESKTQKIACISFGLSIIDEEVFSLSSLKQMIKSYT